jgi:predicted glutamine amidotransferase
MCGIAAFQVPDGVSINARQLAHSLLTMIETRGNHASGFAWIDQDGNSGFYKQPKAGSQLNLGELPRNAKTVILHTRYATQGDRRDNRNNHPVLSTDNTIALVHNGVISNDYQLTSELGITREEHGEVDSLVIPSLIAQQGVEGLSKLRGYAAIAWLDAVRTGKQLHIAKLKSSPVAYTHLPNGTFVMASTPSILELALMTIDWEYGGVFELSEQRYITVDNGIISSHTKSPSMAYDYQAFSRHSNATSGGHGTTTPIRSTAPAKRATAAAGGSEDRPKTVRFTASGDIIVDGERVTGPNLEEYKEDLAKWQEQQAARDMKNAERPMVNFGDDDDEKIWDYSDLTQDDAAAPSDDEQFESIVARMEAEEAVANMKDEGFYIVDAEGAMEHYMTLDDLENRLAWLAKMSKSGDELFTVEKKVNWVNHIMDLGSVQAGGVLESWVEDSSDIDTFESPSVRNLQYIREGAHYLGLLKGA